MSNIQKYKEDLQKLIQNSDEILKLLTIEDFKNQVENYEIWYSEALALVKNILPDRLSDFLSCYNVTPGRTGLQGLFHRSFISYDIISSANILFKIQIGIIKSCNKKFESSLFDIKDLLQADLFDNELMMSKELLDKNFNRASGAIAGVVLERHLKRVCFKHNCKIPKKPHISDLNDALKKDNIYEIDMFRRIQFLGDLRNLCDHDNGKEPTKYQISELISGTEKVIKTVF